MSGHIYTFGGKRFSRVPTTWGVIRMRFACDRAEFGTFRAIRILARAVVLYLARRAGVAS